MFPKSYFMKWIQRVMTLLTLALMMGASCSDEQGTDSTPVTATFRASGQNSYDAAGYVTDLVLDLTAPAGTEYTLSIMEGGSWCWLSKSQATTKRDKMAITTRSERLYLSENYGSEREAQIEVAFSTGVTLGLTLRQASYDKPALYGKAWAELPDYVEQENTMTVTHYAEVAKDKSARNFTVNYDLEKCYANWIAYPLHSCYMQGTYNRSEDWNYDPKIPINYQANLRRGSYSGYGWVRGHQVMSNHRYVPHSEELNAQTFYSTNIMPQAYDFNGGNWLDMEERCTAIAKGMVDTLYIVTGAHGNQGYTTDKEGKRVVIPSHCYKVLLRSKSGKSRKPISDFTSAEDLMAIGYWAPNEDSSNDKSVSYWTCSVAEIEAKTGYRFFAMLPEAIADEVKQQHNPSAWGIR